MPNFAITTAAAATLAVAVLGVIPVFNELLLYRVQKTVAAEHQTRINQSPILTKMKSLTPREHQVLKLVVAGETNKNIAQRLNISEKTVEVHRASMMEKMQAKSLLELENMVVGIP